MLLGQPKPAPTSNTAVIRDGTAASFMADVIQASQKAPVIVDFWAPWCGPCKQLTPLLEKAVTAAGGAVTLVKINIDQNQALAGQLRIQSVPTVYAFFQGQPVDGFAGMQSESQIRTFVARLVELTGAPAAEADALPLAKELLAQGQVAAAAEIFSSLLAEKPDNAEALASLAQCYMQLNQPAQARQLLASAPETIQTHPAVKAVQAALHFAALAADLPELSVLQEQQAKAPQNYEVAHQLAIRLFANAQAAAALDALLAIIAQDKNWQDGKARQTLLDMFAALGMDNDLVLSARRRLASIVY